MAKYTKRAKPIGVSWVIAGLLVASGLIRLFNGPGAAIAREVANIQPSSGQNQELLGSCVSGTAMDELLQDLDRQEATLEERKINLDLRERDVEAGAVLVAAQLKELSDAERRLSDLIAMAETAAESDISQLTSVYEQMKPKEAAAVFEEMAPEFAAGFLGRMRPESAARVFAGLTPKTAYSISAILAGRNVGAPTE